ncbi:hypothetical protein FOZ60_011974 [Perkinsus olseni]|uniref:Uncharacterized protein n=1 Tax=Perkinsus olseni TaxID=32597 RepID=A0A7J6NCB8_PEROL|nr:hypothetical protein FOZ60_011974 [Perkinsus olseni]
MTFILSFIISALLFIAVSAAPVGKYLSYIGTSAAMLIYIKEDDTVVVIFMCQSDKAAFAGPYPLLSGPGVNEYVIGDGSNPQSTLLDLAREHCPEKVFLPGDLHNISFVPDKNSLITSLESRSDSFHKVDDSFLIPYRSTYADVDIEVYVSRSASPLRAGVRVTMKCGDSEVIASLFFESDKRSNPSPRYVLPPEEIVYHDEFKNELSAVCGIDLSPDDFKTMVFDTSTTAFTELKGERLPLTAL